MHLFSLNMHSLQPDTDTAQARARLIDYLVSTPFDVAAFQEVSQSIAAPIAAPPVRFSVVGDIALRADNYALSLYHALEDAQCPVYVVWMGVKKSYGTCEEGVAFISPHELVAPETVQLSTTTAYDDWRKRAALGVCVAPFADDYFYTAHFGWWDDEIEPFQAQFERYMETLAKKQKKRVWLMADCNVEDNSEGYTYIKDHGLLDTYELAQHTTGHYTTGASIDGWRNSAEDVSGRRIDYIWTNKPAQITSARVLFSENENTVSDHFALLVEVADESKDA